MEEQGETSCSGDGGFEVRTMMETTGFEQGSGFDDGGWTEQLWLLTEPSCSPVHGLTGWFEPIFRTLVTRNLLSKKFDSLENYNEITAATLVSTGPEIHTFYLPIGEVTITLEDVTHILGLLINGDSMTGTTDSSHEFLVDNYVVVFGR
ncbi:hypothetical protein Ahy_A10g048749 [Arachis hypogaea]|uniref:Aminotransferase-like plant mobile domain-containing protein n=1 Tax=Arachis hypogaea TaxID=3818 RepID=A0A445B5W1_ARAHY|nr:hypothetical protein Ahy_A10g048749 [Arachis hypogaea]